MNGMKPPDAMQLVLSLAFKVDQLHYKSQFTLQAALLEQNTN
jgi:hypothetical protein